MSEPGLTPLKEKASTNEAGKEVVMRKVITAAAVVAAMACAPIALAASSPSVTAGPATSIGNTTATLHGTVNPNGLATTYHFEYGPTQALGSVSPTVAPSAGAGTTAVPVSTKVIGLSPDTTYYYELVASNSAGTATTPIQSLKTTGHPAPVTITSPAVGVGRYQATLVGIINPAGATTTYHFEYGLSASYGFQSSSKTLPAGNAPVAVSILLPGLAPGTVYHYRLVASHGATSVRYGADETFQTAPWPRPHTHLYFRVRPHTSLRAPFGYLVTGRVGQGIQVPAAYGCHGTVTVRFFQGHRQLSIRIVPIGLTTCTYRSSIRLANVHGSGRLTVRLRYNGDVWGAPSTASGSVFAR